MMDTMLNMIIKYREIHEEQGYSSEEIPAYSVTIKQERELLIELSDIAFIPVMHYLKEGLTVMGIRIIKDIRE
jgi:hypothetical protein